MIYQTVNFSTFCDAFHNMGRSEQFTYEGKKALFDFLEEISDGSEDMQSPTSKDASKMKS